VFVTRSGDMVIVQRILAALATCAAFYALFLFGRGHLGPVETTVMFGLLVAALVIIVPRVGRLSPRRR
jgi:hypothetical protein